MRRMFRAGSEGFTFVDTVAALLLSAVAAGAVVPLFAVFIRRWPEYQVRRRDAVSLMNLEADLRRELGSAEVPYWSGGPGLSGETEGPGGAGAPGSAGIIDIERFEGGLAWGEGDSRVRVLRGDGAVSVSSSGVTRRYRFTDAPGVSVLFSEGGGMIGVRITAAGGAAADVLFGERRLESDEEPGLEDAGN